eukprot:759579-Hanusia_phi.AAC.1
MDFRGYALTPPTLAEPPDPSQDRGEAGVSPEMPQWRAGAEGTALDGQHGHFRHAILCLLVSARIRSFKTI